MSRIIRITREQETLCIDAFGYHSKHVWIDEYRLTRWHNFPKFADLKLFMLVNHI